MTQDMINKIMTRNMANLTWGQAPCEIRMRLRLAVTLLLMMVVGVNTVWGQTDYSGTYYLRNMQATNAYWYLVPCMGSGCFYQDNDETPFLTTYQTNQDMNSLWRLEKVTVDATDYYRFIHNATGLYVTYNEVVLDYSSNNNLAPRLRMHLEAFETPTDATLFFIKPHSSNGQIAIRPKDGYDDVNNYYWWDMSSGNKSSYWNNNWEGSLGLWHPLTGAEKDICKWQLIDATATCATPVITYNESTGEISISYPISGDSGVTIHYTTDGSEPTDGSPSYSTAFSATGVKMVRAIAVKSSYNNSSEAVLYGPNQPYLFKTIDEANVSYYMIPPTDDSQTTNLNVTTSNVPNERMQWLLKPAVLSAGVQYYYFVNAITGKYLYCNANENQGSALLMKDLNEAGTEADRYMFRFIDYGTYLNIVPKKFARLIPSSGNKNCLRKQNATDHTYPIGIYGNDNDLARWTATSLPDNPKSLWSLPATIVSSTGDVKYLKLHNGPQTNSTDYFVYPPSDKVYATAATSGSHPEWYLWPADDSDPWCTYYYIRNAYTGQYLYFDGVAYNNNDNKFFTSATDLGDKCKFLVLRTANTTYSGSYHIVPKLIRNNNNQTQIALNRNNNTLKTIASRNTGGSCWFFDATTFTCDAPTFSYDAVLGVLSMASPNNAPIYYVGWNDGDSEPRLTTPADGNLYTYPIEVNYTHYKAITARCTDGSDKSSAATYNLAASFQCATPVISFNSSTQKLSIACATMSATIYYIVGDGTFSESASNYGGTVYTAPFTLADPATVKAIAIRNSDWSTASVVAVWDKAPHYIDRASEMTDMALYYVANEGFSADATIGTSSAPFTGTFDGAYTSFSLSRSLFDYVDGATIKNVCVSSATVSGTGNKGVLVNEATGASRIYNCGVLAGTVTSSDKAAGGLVGHIASGSSVRVVNCYNYASVSGSTHAAGIVGWNEGTVGDVRIALCMMYGDMMTGTNRSPVYGGNHTSNVKNYTEYNFWRSKANLTYTAYNDQLAIDKDDYLTRFPFYRHILNTHRELAAFFLFGESGETVNDITAAEIAEIGHWVLKKDVAAYPIVEEWQTNTKRTTVDIAANLPNTTDKGAGKLLKDIGDDDYYIGTGTKVTAMGNSGYLTVNLSINRSSYSVRLPITDIDEANYDYTWGKVVLPFANEFSGWTRDYSKVCTGWEITGITGGTAGTFAHYNVADRDCTAKDLYDNSGYIFAQGGNYIVPYGVTAISVTAHFANAFYLSDASYEVGYDTSFGGATALGGSVPTTYHGRTVYTSLETLVTALSETTNPHDQAIVLVGNFHNNIKVIGNKLNTSKAVTIMSTDEDCNQEPDYGWYTCNLTGRLDVPPLRFDFVPNIEMGMSSRVGSSVYPGIGIWHARGWFELTETCVSKMIQCEINDYDFTNSDNGKGNNRWIANSGYFTQVVRARDGNCDKLSYIQIGGNAYVKELYPGSHTDNARTNAAVPIAVTGGQVEECFMTGYKTGGKLNGDLYFWCTGGKIGKFLGAYLEEPIATTGTTAGITAKVDHALIGRFFGGGTSSAARIKGNIDITINNSQVDFYCGGPEFGNMESGKTVTTHATGTTFGEYYGAGFGGTSITYNREAQTQQLTINSAATTTYDLSFTNNYKRLTNKSGYGIGCCYKFEYIFHSNGSNGVTRFYTGYAQFDLATTGNVTNILSKCKVKKLPGTNSLTPLATSGDFYGAGCQGKVDGTVTTTLTDCEVEGSAYGGGYKAESNEVSVYPTTQPTYSVYTRETGLFSDFGTVEPETYNWKSGTAGKSNQTSKELYTDVVLTDLGNVTGDISITIGGNSKIGTGSAGGCVFGGGNESKSLNNTTVTIVNGTVTEDVYGGGNLADVTGNTKLNLIGGTVNRDVYGGGKGRLAKDDVEAKAATVGDATVYLNGMDASDYRTEYTTLAQEDESGPYTVKDDEKGCIVKGNIFGCNNLNGTPLGSVTVHIYATQRDGATRITDTEEVTDAKVDGEKNEKGEYILSSFDVQAVYGGGNLAAYEPTDATSTDAAKKAAAHTNVIIDGCHRTSIGQVYGGGNAASTPATSVTVNGTYEIGELFGGGNGKDQISKDGGKTWLANPGANVGFSAYDVDAANAQTPEERSTNYGYGSGKAAVNIFGGTIHRVFGGSNTKGNVRQTAVTMLDERSTCDFQVDEAYGGGKSAPMDAEAKLLMACIPGLKQAYGGAEAADIQGNVVLNITNGTFDRVFGGNNLSGTIRGSITVNIEEVGCKPIIIGELYGGGNLAGYSIYGYKEVTEGEGESATTHWVPIEDPDDPEALSGNNIYADPQVNVKSFTSIGNIYGGGYGASAVMVGNPTVEINEVLGEHASSVDAVLGEDYTTPSGYPVPPHASGAIGAINNVFGGGNAAAVKGSTTVKIGTRDKWTVTAPKKDTNGKTLYEEDGVTPKTEVKEKDVVGANIVGNVYGGGNEAEVTGNTNVQIGKKM